MIKKYGIIQRYVDESDAEFILSLRLNKKLSQYLTKTENNLEKQIEWIKAYKEREKQGKEFYFITIDENGNRYGVNRLYNFDNYSFEAGSWLFSNETNSSISILADLATRDFGFCLNEKFNACRFEVRKDNLSVIAYHKRFKPELINEDESKYYFSVSKNNFEEYKNKLLKIYGYGNK